MIWWFGFFFLWLQCDQCASQTGIGVVAYLIKKDNGIRRSHIFYSKSTLMPKNLCSNAAVEDALTIARAELIALVMCINMSIYIRNALKPNVPSGKVHIFTDSLLNLQRVQRGLGKCKPWEEKRVCLLYTSPSPRDQRGSRMPSSA